MNKLLKQTMVFICFPFLFIGCEKISQTGTVLPPKASVVSTPQTVDRIVLTNGGIIEGKLVEEAPEMVRIEWQGGVVGFQRGEIQSIEKAAAPVGGAGSSKDGLYVPTFQPEKSAELEWPKGADHLIYMANGERIGGRILKKSKEALTVRQQFEEGGAAVIEINLDKVEKIELWPPDKEAGERFRVFQEHYPLLKLIQRGYYHVLTSEQDPVDLKLYLNSLDQFYHDFLLHFFDLFDLSKQHEPLDVIIFGTRDEFEQTLKEIGFNLKSNPIGFYHFQAKKLVFYNAKSETAVQNSLAKSRAFQSKMAELSSEVETKYGSQGNALQNQIGAAADQAARSELQIMADIRSRTGHVLRHEGGHQLFHLLGILPAEIYQGGWLVEGLAVYCETTPIGDIHTERLMELRFAIERNELMPLEYLMNFGRGGDFHKMDPLYAYLAYAESWAFVYFLMQDQYRELFLNYIRDISKQGPDFNTQKDRELFEKHLGKSLKELEQEFVAAAKKWVSEFTDENTYQEYRLSLMKAT